MALPVYVINLERRPDRWHAVVDHLDRIGLKAERILAVDANTLADRVGPDEDIPFSPTHFGHNACTLSHYKALQTLLDSSAPAALILEDDAEVASDTPSLLESMDWWPTATEVIRLEGYAGERGRIIRRPSGKTPSGREVRRLESRIFNSAGYLISRTGSRIVLESSAPLTVSHNTVLFDPYLSKTARKLATAQIVPAMVRQRPSSDVNPSDLAPWPERLTADQHRKRRKFRFRRRIQVLPHKVKSRLLLVTGVVQRVPVSYMDRFEGE